MMSEPTPEISRNVSPSEGISAMELRMMPRDEVVALYHRLEAPPFEEMHGEFAASLLDQGSARGYLLSAFILRFQVDVRRGKARRDMGMGRRRE